MRLGDVLRGGLLLAAAAVILVLERRRQARPYVEPPWIHRGRNLAVELRRVVGHRKEDPQNFSIGDFLRIERDLHRLGMTGPSAADGMVLSRALLAARITR